jgi:hypothetical protein
MLKFTQQSPSHYSVLADNRVHVGELLQGDDGYFDLWLDSTRQGALSQGFLQEVVAKLQELNRSWDEQVARGISKQKPIREECWLRDVLDNAVAAKNQWPEWAQTKPRWRCKLCGRDRFSRSGQAHNCVGGYRKNFKKEARLRGWVSCWGQILP